MTYTPPEGVAIGNFTTDTLPASFRAPADAVISYKIYGTSGGAGVVTESGEPAGYKIPISISDGTNTSNYDLFIGSTKLGAEEYVDYAEQKRVKEVVKNASLSFDANTTSTKNVWQGVIPAKGKFIMSYMQEQTLISNSRNTPAIHLSNGTYIYKSANSNNQLEAGRYSWVIDLDYDDVNIDSLLYWVSIANTNLIISDINFLKLTDPPAPLPAINTYKGENTLSSTETLGDIELTGDWLAIMGSTEDESIDIDFTVDAEEYIAFVTVDDDPQIQVSDTITMPSSADSFTLEVLSWGRERYTETVYNALS